MQIHLRFLLYICIRRRGELAVKLSEWIKSFWYYVTVPFCVHCKRKLSKNFSVFCPLCLSRYKNAKLRNCSRCCEILSRCTCTSDYLDTHLVHRLVKVIRYVPSIEDMPQNRLIFSLKRENRADVAQFCAAELADAIRHGVENYKDFILTYVPRRNKAKRKYGVDQAQVLAENLSALLQIPMIPTLRSLAKTPQKKLSAAARRKNAAFAPRLGVNLSGKRILLVDDIVTTGASMGGAAVHLRGLGAKEIVGVCFAIAYRDPYVPFEKPAYRS